MRSLWYKPKGIISGLTGDTPMPRNLNTTSTWEVPRNLKFIYVDILNFFFFFFSWGDRGLPGRKKKAESQRKSRTLRFEKACQVPSQHLAEQPVFDSHWSSAPGALLLTLASWRDVPFAQQCCPAENDGVCVAPALRPVQTCTGVA